jgi:trehalose utilization protein
VFISSFTGGEVFRSGMCWSRGLGKVFYFSPGHEEHPVYHQADIQRVLANAVRWCRPASSAVSVGACVAREPGWFYEPGHAVA